MSAANVQLNYELSEHQNFADRQFVHAVTHTSMRDRVISPQEMMSYKEAQKNKWTEDNGTVLKLEDSLRKLNPFKDLPDVD